MEENLQENKSELSPVISSEKTQNRKVVPVVMVLLIILVVVLSLIVVLNAFRSDNNTGQLLTNTPTQTEAPIRNENDLKKLEEEINNTSFDDINSEVEKNFQDVADL